MNVQTTHYRADRDFAELLLEKRPDILDRLSRFFTPISEDTDASLLGRLHHFGLLPDELRENFYECVRQAIVEEADASFLNDSDIRDVFSEDEIESLLEEAEMHVLKCIPSHVQRLKYGWDNDYDPDEYYDQFKSAIHTFVKEVSWRADYDTTLTEMSAEVEAAVLDMESEYEPPKRVTAPTSSKEISDSPLAHIFKDVDD